MNDHVLAQIETPHVRAEFERLQELNRTLERALQLAAYAYKDAMPARVLPGDAPLRIADTDEWVDYWIRRARIELEAARR